VVDALTAGTVGGTVDAVHAEIIEYETLGSAEGVAGQRFTLSRRPVVPGGLLPPRLEVSSEQGWQEWTRVESFAASGPNDRHFQLDGATGTVAFGPVLRLPDGGLRHHGAVPAAGSTVRMTRYCVGGGVAGNVGAGAIRTLKASIPFVAGVRNLAPARGGADGESLDQARARGPVLLRTRSRAVTAEDYEAFSAAAAPEIARVRCLTPGESRADPGSPGPAAPVGDADPAVVRILVVPAVEATRAERPDLGDLVPAEATLRRIAERLDEVRVIGARVVVEPPRYLGVTVVARLVARPRASATRVEADALTALHRYLNPLTGGPGGDGWPFGRSAGLGEVFSVLSQVPGVELVEDVRLFAADPLTGRRGAQVNRLTLDPGALIFSYQHQVRVDETERPS